MGFTLDSITFVLVVILRYFVLYCVDASFISGRAIVQFSRKLFLVDFRAFF